eukprot:5073453-Pyramimonas_sp.AAC.1
MPAIWASRPSRSAATSGPALTSPLEDLKERIEALSEDAHPSIRKIQDARAETTEVKARAEKDRDNKSASMLVADIEKMDKNLVEVAPQL